MTNVQCPHCRKQIQIQLTPAASRPHLPGWNFRQPAQNFQSAAALPFNPVGAIAPEPAFDEYYRQAPARAADFNSDVIVPGAQAIVSGIAAILPGIAAVNLLNALGNWAIAESGVTVNIPWYTALWIAGGVTSFVWYHYVKDHNASLWQTEEGKRRQPVQPAPPVVKSAPPVIPVEILNRHPATEDEPHIRRLDIPGIDLAELQQLAAGLRKGTPLTEEEWTPQKDGKPFGSRRYRQIINTLDALGFTELINPASPQQGRRLTFLGESVFAKIAAGESPYPAGK